ncbi:MAG: acyltransferase family protein [Burkholderiaceae bacterium]
MTHRKDIQVLRGLSIVFVLLFHFEVSGAGNGFLGVDIFFVISGFLMALLYDKDDISGFFGRRARRLLPAYFTTIVATALAAAWLTLPAEFTAVGSETMFASFLVSNVGYWLADSYFDKTVFKPLLHLWSLGVEFQFFLLVPALAWLHRLWRPMLPLLMLASLVACLLAVSVSSKTAFFLLPFRLWEFLAGAITAIVFTHRGAVPAGRNSWPGIVGLLVLLAIPLMGVEGEARNVAYGHPGLFAVVVCAATALVLSHGLPAGLVNNWLGKVFQVLGKYSYSIYLVHFPVIVLHLYQPFSGTILGTGGPLDALAMLVLIASLSVAMYHLIEKPARNSNWSLPGMAALPGLALIVVATGFGAQRTAYTPSEMRIFSAISDEGTFRCGRLLRMREPLALSCEITDQLATPKGNIMLVGNSHANMIKAMFAQVAQEMNYRVRFLVPNDPLMHGGSDPEDVINEALRTKVTSLVLHYSPGAIEPATVKKLVDLAARHHLPVRFLTPVPVWNTHIPIALWRNLRFGEPLPSLSIRDYQVANASLLSELAAIHEDNFKIVNVGQVMCQSECMYRDNTGTPFYLDDHHLTLTGSQQLSGLVRDVIRDLP